MIEDETVLDSIKPMLIKNLLNSINVTKNMSNRKDIKKNI